VCVCVCVCVRVRVCMILCVCVYDSVGGGREGFSSLSMLQDGVES